MPAVARRISRCASAVVVAVAGLVALASPAPAAADAELPNDRATVDALPMRGPFATLDDVCDAEGQTDHARCLSAATECASPAAGKLAGPFTEFRVLHGCTVALRAAAGWFVLSIEGLPLWAGFLHAGYRYLSDQLGVTTTADRGAVLVRGTFVHWTNPDKMPWLAPAKLEEWYECEERLFVCRFGDSGPGCAGPFPVSYTTYCREATRPEHALRRRDSHDFRFTPTVAGTTLTLRGGAAGAPRAAPLPGWAVIALDAPGTVGVTRPLSPERVELRF